MNAPDSITRRSNLDNTLLARTAPLPISSYFDVGWFEREMLLLFDKGPNYVGSEMMVPEVGDYMTLPWTENGKVLVRGPGGVNLLSNTCRHRQGLIPGDGLRTIVRMVPAAHDGAPAGRDQVRTRMSGHHWPVHPLGRPLRLQPPDIGSLKVSTMRARSGDTPVSPLAGEVAMTVGLEAVAIAGSRTTARESTAANTGAPAGDRLDAALAMPPLWSRRRRASSGRASPGRSASQNSRSWRDGGSPRGSDGDERCTDAGRSASSGDGRPGRRTPHRVRWAEGLSTKALIRGDANQGYGFPQAETFVRGVNPEGIEFFEQPLKENEWEAMAGLAKISPVPLGLDESIYGMESVEKERRLQCCRFVKFKLMKVASAEILAENIKKCEEYGFGVVLGNGAAGEINCYLEALAASRTTKRAGEMNGFFKQTESILAAPIKSSGAKILLEPGYLLALNPEGVDRHAVARAVFE